MATNEALPAHADVVIVGGGIVGCAAAYYLAKRALSAVLVEKDEIGRAQSGRNWGFIRQQGRDPLELPLMIGAVPLPVEIFQTLQFDFDPAVLSISSIVIVLSALFIVFMQRIVGLDLILPGARR